MKTLDKADKAKTEVTLTEKDVQEAQAKYDIWKKLLNESITKIKPIGRMRRTKNVSNG